MASIHIITNPRSGKNRKHPTRFDQMHQRALAHAHPDNTLTVHKPETLDALHQVVENIRAQNGDILCIHGGDGTVHQVMTALWRVYGRHTPYPTVALLKGGTMNNIARNVGVPLFSSAEQLLLTIAQNNPIKTSTHHPIVVDNDQSGFIYGSVALAPFMDAYEDGPEPPSPWKGFKLFVQTIVSVIFGTAFSQQILAAVTMGIHFDKHIESPKDYTMLGISSVADVGFYFRPFYKTINNPHTLQCLAMNCSPMHIVWSIPNIWLARPTNSNRIIDRTATQIHMEYTNPQRYTIDGDIYTSQLSQTIELGPEITFLHT